MTREHGSAAVEVVLLAPAALGFFSLVVFGGRLALAQQVVQTAAADAARAASVSRTAAQAGPAARTAALATTAELGVSCEHPSVEVELSAFGTQVGSDAVVSARVVCHIATSDLLLPGLDGNLRVKAEADSVLDTYRERSRR